MNLLWIFIKHKLEKLGCFFLIALLMIAVTAITKLILGWFGYDEATKVGLSEQVGEYLGKGILLLMVIVGFFMVVRQLIIDSGSKRSSPPPLPPIPPPLPHVTPPSLHRESTPTDKRSD
ncbi:MAG: hypothetical protein V4727_12125 [Verrucomicrobiota bacterium]